MTMRKTFKANPPAAKAAPAPDRPLDHTRTFDARPKPSDQRPHLDPRYRPSAHVDPVLDNPQAETTGESEE